MDYLNTYKVLDEEIAFASMERKFLQLLPKGTVGGWFQKQDSVTNWIADCRFDFDVLEHFPFLREEITGKFLEISFDKCFQVRLIRKIRIGGYKEPWEDECVAATNGRTVYQALAKMNSRLKRKQDIKDISVVNFESYKRNLQLLKK